MRRCSILVETADKACLVGVSALDVDDVST